MNNKQHTQYTEIKLKTILTKNDINSFFTIDF